MVELIEFGDENEFISSYYQNIYDRRYLISVTSSFEKAYNYWDRIGDILNSYYPDLLKIKSEDFARVLDALEARGMDNEFFNWFLNFKNNEYKELNDQRKNLVHYHQYETKFKYLHMSNVDNLERMGELWEEKRSFPEYFKRHLELSREGFYNLFKLLELILMERQ